MSATNPDPRSRASQRLRDAKAAWGQAMTAHKMAPPDDGFAGRLRSLASAAETEREACEEAEQAGLLWRPIPGAQGSRPTVRASPRDRSPWALRVLEPLRRGGREAQPRDHGNQCHGRGARVCGARIGRGSARRCGRRRRSGIHCEASGPASRLTGLALPRRPAPPGRIRSSEHWSSPTIRATPMRADAVVDAEAAPAANAIAREMHAFRRLPGLSWDDRRGSPQPRSRSSGRERVGASHQEQQPRAGPMRDSFAPNADEAVRR